MMMMPRIRSNDTDDDDEHDDLNSQHHHHHQENDSTHNSKCDHLDRTYQYHITGCVAYSRIQPLLLLDSTTNDWIEYNFSSVLSQSSSHSIMKDHALNTTLHFLWENTPRAYTKDIRDYVLCYSHLPNGTFIYDSKYVLGRLMGQQSQMQRLLPSTDKSPPSPSYVAQYGPLATLTTHCFRGRSGYDNFIQQVGLDSINTTEHTSTLSSPPPPFLDLMEHDFSRSSNSSRSNNTTMNSNYTTRTCNNNSSNELHRHYTNQAPTNAMWVVKDAYSNGAGGIWVLGPNNIPEIAAQLYPEHSYVAQQYVHPMVLYQQRKCHVRVYALITSDQRAFVHHQCFLHVANDIFTVPTRTDTSTTTIQTTPYQDSVHITNCCANSHDPNKFAGEICADLHWNQHQYCHSKNNNNDDHIATNDNDKNNTSNKNGMVLGLQPFASSIYASVERLVQVTLPFVQGGQQNNGFEYLGLDFILSYDELTYQPMAYLLEVNAPPSQDTATKLPHAEHVHNTVLRDLLHLWVYPHICTAIPERLGGWDCVYDGRNEAEVNHRTDNTTNNTVKQSLSTILPSKAAILNKIRWNLYERHQLKLDQQQQQQKRLLEIQNAHDLNTSNMYVGNDGFASYARRYFPYYQQEKPGSTFVATGPSKVFFENAGGTQVPEQIIQSMNVSLSYRHRSVVGTESVQAAKAVVSTLLGASPTKCDIYFGSNASTLLNNLAQWYIRTDQIRRGDEILIQVENHMANVAPWIEMAKVVGATILWWDASSTNIVNVMTPKTRIIAISHASNIIGQCYDHPNLRQIVDETTKGYGHIIVDGVTYVPHRYADIEKNQFDWYAISCHKLFGPHLGVLCGRRNISTISTIHDTNVTSEDDSVIRRIQTVTTKYNNDILQFGTVNYEACEGIRGLGRYFLDLYAFDANGNTNGICLDQRIVSETYRSIESTEVALLQYLLNGLQRSKKVRIIGFSALSTKEQISNRLPIISLVHATIPSTQIVDKCYEGGVICRNGTFLSTERLQHIYSIDDPLEGVVRFSMAHYNTCSEVKYALSVLESIPGWM